MKIKKFLFLIAPLFLLSCSQKFITRDTLSREIAISKIFVFPFLSPDNEASEFSEFTQETVIKEIKKTKKYRYFSFSKTRKLLKKEAILGEDFTKKEALFTIKEKTGADAAIIGTLTNNNIEISLISTITAIPLFTVKEEISGKLTSHSVKAMTGLLLRRLLSFIPYDAIVLKIRGNKVKINAGQKRKLRGGAKVTLFDITSYRREGKRYTYKKIPIALAKLTNIKKTYSIGKILKHNTQFPITEYLKVSFTDFFTPIEPEK